MCTWHRRPSVCYSSVDDLARFTNLPARDAQNVREIAEAGEWQIAVEILCTQLYEFDVIVPKPFFAALSAVAKESRVADRYLAVLAVAQ